MGEVDANAVQADAIKRAWGFRTQGAQYQNEALMKRASASGIDPGMAAFSSILSEGTKMASSYMTMKKAGMFEKAAEAPAADQGSTMNGLDPNKSSYGLKAPTVFWG
jgi:hypothetical protein